MAAPPDPPEFEAFFLAHLATIDRITATLSYRKALVGDEADDFKSWVYERLIEKDYATLRKYRGGSSIATFLNTVIVRIYLDYRVKHWKRWRSSAAARRLGVEAVRLEALLYRDGYSLSQAIEVMHSSGTRLTERELIELHAKIPARTRTSERTHAVMPDAPGSRTADQDLRDDEKEREEKRVRQVINQAMEELPAEDQVIVRLRFWQGPSIADIARMLNLEAKPLYRRLERALAHLRTRLEAEGVNRDTLIDLLDSGEFP
ncbi:MAG TPA: sigma-70 family RNA polymerase sigma factor [Longimicrobium sp.]|nr:sigma-70 family RNA polymerase sigma factor [Longimicrobium sp.]